MKYLKIRIASGNSDSLFDIFYDSPSGVGQALLFDTGLPAVAIPYDTLIIDEGITVSVPDNATSIILDSSPSAFCTSTSGVNTPMYTIPIGCMSYTVSSSIGISNYYYTDCDCVPVTATIDATYGYTEQTFCALQDTVNAGLLTVVDNGSCVIPITCISLIGTVISPIPQSGPNNFYGANVSLDPWPVSENVTVTGYIRDDDNPSNQYDFSIIINSPTQSAETANNVLVTGPASTATMEITGVTPTTVTYDGNSVYFCGFQPTAILSFDQYYIGEFYFSVSSPLSASITISDCGVIGYNAACSNSPGTDTMSTSGIIGIGETSTTVPGNTPLNCDNENYLQGNNIRVNGTSLQDGDTITIGGTIVSININYLTGCSGNPYACA